MCNFFSLISSGDGRVYYFSPEQHIAGVTMPNGSKCYFDSHAFIAEFYGLDEDECCNRWTYNPFSEKLVLDMQLTADDRESVLEEIKKINFDLICGDVEGAREFIEHLKTMKFLDGHGDIPDGVKMFDTMEEARDVAWYAVCDAAWDAAWEAADDAVWETAWKTAWEAAWKASSDALSEVVDDAILFIRLIYLCPGLSIDQKHIDYIKKRWSIWEAGYGVLCDANGVLYCYKNN